MRTYGTQRAVYFQGHRLADLRDPNVRICGTFSKNHWECSKVRHHKGSHVAHCTDDETGLPDEIVDEWFDETADAAPTEGS